MNETQMDPTISQMAFVPMLDILRDLVYIFSDNKTDPAEFLTLSLEYNTLLDAIMSSREHSLDSQTIEFATTFLKLLSSYTERDITFGCKQMAALKTAHIGYVLSALGADFSTYVDPIYWTESWIANGRNPLERVD